MKNKTDQISQNVAKYVINNPKKLLLAGMIFLALLVPGLARLKTDFGYRIWFKQDDPLLARFDAFERRFGNDDQSIIAIHSPSGIFDNESVELIQKITTDMWLVPEIIRVDSLANFNWVHAVGDEIKVEAFIPEDQKLTPEFLKEREKIALNHETIPNYLVSKDSKTAVIYASVQPKMDGAADYQKIASAMMALKEKYSANAGDHQFYVTGNAALSDSFREATEKDMSKLLPMTLAVIIIFLAFSFRSAKAVGVALIVIFASIMTTLGTLGWLGLKFNNLTSIIPQILIAVAVADAVHLLVSYLKAINAGMNRKDAAEYSISKNFFPTILTSLTTAVGFFSFGQASLLPIAQMGLGAGLGTVYAWILTYLFVAPLMVLTKMKSSLEAESESEEHDKIPSSILRFTEFIYRQRYVFLGIGAVLTVLSLVASLRNVPNSDPYAYFAKDFHLTKANDFLETNMGGGLGVELVIDSGKVDGIKDPEWLTKVEKFQKWMEAQPKITKVVSIIDILKSMNRSLHADKQEYFKIPETKETAAQLLFLYTMSLPQGMDLNNRMTLDNDAIRMTALWTLHESNESIRRFDEMEAVGKELGLNVQVTGKGPLYQRMNGYVVPTFINSVVWSTLLIGFIMIFALKSVKLGVISMIPNLLPNVIGGAYVYLSGMYLDIGTVIVASVCLGIAVDDTIHYLVNFARAVRSGSTSREAIAWVLNTSGNAMLVTTLVLVCSFGTFAFAQFVPNANFGKLVALILSFALVCEVFLTGSLLMVAEKWLIPRKDAPAAERERSATI